MTITHYTPTARLQPFIRQYLIIESEAGVNSQVLPDTSMVLAFCFKGAVMQQLPGSAQCLPASVFSGLRKSLRRFYYTPASATLLVKFTESGAASFFRLPMHELFNQSLPLDQLLPPSQVAAITEQLAGAGNHRQRIALAEQWLCNRLLENKTDALVHQAIQCIKAAHGIIRVRELAAQLHISQDPFEKRFRQAAGTTPKNFAEIVRLRYLVSQQPDTNNLTGLAHAAGFFDQAHFIKKFRAFTGQAPQQFFSNTQYW